MTVLATSITAATFFACWASALLLERRVGLGSKTALFYTKALVTLVLLAVAAWPLLDGDPKEYQAIFVDFAPDAMRQPVVVVASSITLAWYSFEAVVISQRARIDWSAVVHHWVTAVAATVILLGNNHPTAILYGMAMTALAFPVPALFGARSHLSGRFPATLRRAHYWVWRYYTVLFSGCLLGQFVLLAHGLTVGEFSAAYCSVLLVFFAAWVRDDLALLRHLKKCWLQPRPNDADRAQLVSPEEQGLVL